MEGVSLIASDLGALTSVIAIYGSGRVMCSVFPLVIGKPICGI